MLNQLIESRNHAEENAKRGGFLLGTFFLVATMLSSGVLWSLFAKNIEIGGDSLELSAIVAPIPFDKPEPPAPPKNTPMLQKAEPQTTKFSLPTRQANIARIDEMQPTPTAVSTTPNTQKSRPIGDFLIKNGEEFELKSSTSGDSSRNASSESVGIGKDYGARTSEPIEKPNLPPPPIVVAKKPETAAPRSKAPVSGGVINGKALNLPKPLYSAAAKAVNASGEVSVQVTLDETGKVISAKALNGHPMLRGEAEKAARDAKFSPTILTGIPVKVSGIIVYKFSRS